jgi:hypothetical protein
LKGASEDGIPSKKIWWARQPGEEISSELSQLNLLAEIGGFRWTS